MRRPNRFPSSRYDRAPNMGEQYSQTLISKSKSFVPTAGAVGKFFSEIVTAGVLLGELTIVVRTPSGKTREFPSPAGGTVVVELKNHNNLANLAAVRRAIEGLADYELEVSAFGRPAT